MEIRQAFSALVLSGAICTGVVEVTTLAAMNEQEIKAMVNCTSHGKLFVCPELRELTGEDEHIFTQLAGRVQPALSELTLSEMAIFTLSSFQEKIRRKRRELNKSSETIIYR